MSVGGEAERQGGKGPGGKGPPGGEARVLAVGAGQEQGRAGQDGLGGWEERRRLGGGQTTADAPRAREREAATRGRALPKLLREELLELHPGDGQDPRARGEVQLGAEAGPGRAEGHPGRQRARQVGGVHPPGKGKGPRCPAMGPSAPLNCLSSANLRDLPTPEIYPTYLCRI
jgi:hypothetical protein